MRYIAVISKDAESDFGAMFPDFPGCVTSGETLDEVVHHAGEVLALHVKGMLEDGDPIPPPTSVQRIADDPEYVEDVVAFLPVEVDVPEVPRGKAERINITMDSELLHLVDAEARRRRMPRSAFLAMAARNALTSR